jgi:hypothetical protein
MYFYTTKFKNSQFGIQGDVQYRNWNTLGDLEQLLLRSGVTYKPTNTDVTLTIGVAHITTGAIERVIKLPLRHRFIKKHYYHLK